jgi:hypothetical protein
MFAGFVMVLLLFSFFFLFFIFLNVGWICNVVGFICEQQPFECLFQLEVNFRCLFFCYFKVNEPIMGCLYFLYYF